MLLAAIRQKSYTAPRPKLRFWLAEPLSRGPFRFEIVPRIGLEDQMDIQSPDARALIWTGLSLAVIIIGAAIAFAVFT